MEIMHANTGRSRKYNEDSKQYNNSGLQSLPLLPSYTKYEPFNFLVVCLLCSYYRVASAMCDFYILIFNLLRSYDFHLPLKAFIRTGYLVY